LKDLSREGEIFAIFKRGASLLSATKGEIFKLGKEGECNTRKESQGIARKEKTEPLGTPSEGPTRTNAKGNKNRGKAGGGGKVLRWGKSFLRS